MSIEGQGHFFTIYFPGFVCFVLYLAKISGERLQDHWSSGFHKGVHTLPMLHILTNNADLNQTTVRQLLAGISGRSFKQHHDKPVLGVSDQVCHKPSCTATENG